ncbi:olfactory receptor 7A17-like [Ursus americanus]|uniref:olfactory receptor 7A17-like n=1 Tax=Ursus americanus TaxID=9643 RepID=UPI001E67AA31|nr:olfactory receptor 7A17-like [Ursus americanus]
MYLITVFGNLLIIMAVSFDSHLHTPMYFFLANLSFVDICFTSTTIPKMLLNIQTQSKFITYAGCITQIYFFVLFAGLDDFLLAVMAYDRFMAICHPLHYMVIMNPQLCALLVLVVWVTLVSLFYCTSLGVYLSSAAPQSSHASAVASVMYTVVTPMLNPFIYSLRNRDIRRALKKIIGVPVLLDVFLLTTVAYDRFVAICHPLHYTVIMNPHLCGLNWVLQGKRSLTCQYVVTQSGLKRYFRAEAA